MRNRVNLLSCACALLLLPATYHILPATALGNSFLWFKSYEAALDQWNAATLASFKQQIAATRFKDSREELDIERAVFESTIGGRAGGKQHSGRMYFLKRAAPYVAAVDSFYVVETSTSGEEVVAHNYLLFDSAGQTRIVAFVHYDHWSPTKNSMVPKLVLEGSMNPVAFNEVRYTHRNESLLILSKFKKGQPIKSTNLVDPAIPENSPIAKLIGR